MTPLEIVDSMYFDNKELKLTTSQGKYSTTIAAIFSQTAAMLENGTADEVRAATNELIIAFEAGIKTLETLETGMRQQEIRNAGY